MILREFVKTSVPAYKLPDILFKYDNIAVRFTDDTEIPEYDAISDARIAKGPVLAELANKKLDMKQFDQILQKYGWYVSKVEENAIHIVKLHGHDTETDTRSVMFLHFTEIPPTTIGRTGFRAKRAEGKGNNLDDRTRYPEQRIYLWKLQGLGKESGDINLDFAKKFRTLTEILGADDYGNYVYLVTVPSNVKIYYDEEYGKDIPARYITQNIPPSSVTFLSTVSKIKEKIADNIPILPAET